MPDVEKIRGYFASGEIAVMRKPNNEVARLLMSEDANEFFKKIFEQKLHRSPHITQISSDIYIMQPEPLFSLYPDHAKELLENATLYKAPQSDRAMAEARLTDRSIF